MISSSFKNPLFFCTIIFFAYLAGLWGTSIPMTGDQKVYLSIALEMYEKKQWIIPTLLGEPNFLKPPFQYWATILGWKAFGLSIFGALIPSVLALISTAFLTFKIGKKINLKDPASAAILFASTIGTMTYGSTAQMEIWIVFFLLSAWLAILHSRIFLAFILVGIMAWVKGPLYPVLFTVSVLIWNRNAWRAARFWCALGIGTVLGLGWYILAARTHQQEMIQQFFYTENLGKMGTHQGSILSLWSEFLFSLFPWVFLLFFGGFQSDTRQRWKQNRKFYLSYAAFSALFFTFFPYRVNSYLYFLTPIMAMMASEVDLGIRSRSKDIVLGIYGSIFVFLSLLIYQLVKGNWIGPEIIFTAILIMILFMMGLYRGYWKYLAFASLILVNLIRVSAVQIGEKDAAGLKEILKNKPGQYAYFIESRDIWHEYGWMSSAVEQSLQRIYTPNEYDSFLAAGGSVILQDDQISHISDRLNCEEWKRLKRRSKFPIQKLLREGIHWGDPEIMRSNYVCSLRK